jgi:F420-dependent oxidoreductase-like protein
LYDRWRTERTGQCRRRANVKIGLVVSNFTWPGGPASIGPNFGRIAREADQAGLASLWVMDHFFQVPLFGPPEHEMLEAYTTLAFAAGQTERIELGALVTGVTPRYPGVLAKTVTTLDVLSGGRAWLGIGAAWNEQESRGLGIPFPPLAERFERLEETLRIVRQMWSGDTRPFQGRHYRLEQPLNSPNALRQPHPPILVGGSGEHKTLRLVARYGDACNLFEFGGLDALRHKLEVLRGHCEAEGRPYEQIEKTTYGQLTGTESTEQLLERFQRLAEVGVDHAIIELPDHSRGGSLDRLAEVTPEVSKLARASG